ncbi:tRNA epoxyqueuosine(34) reductase QueG [Methylobrevis pamukkalensis]|uniref:Epoxyqueuosine reductase n=1 Tax=Methylobrevis pamukkalensis TaxID=1439726 RepID=A0A1E3H287_9HYPH|nr:tRNA epoxyqueuosine(34) reductase QueG [Methylobrevis pamukkalensis]ODN70255.1 Epoxyqueuosine reductase [Methylobrevis pamukkalensis]
MTADPLRAARDRAERLGFGALRVTTPERVAEAGLRLREAIAEGHHGTMDWLADTADRRADPRLVWPDVRSVVMLGLNYGPEGDALANLADPSVANISVYARGRDYHDVIKGKLKEIAGLVERDTGAKVKVFVDTAPVMEKPLAASAGLGWQGKHTNLVSRDFGSWLFLGAIFCAAELVPDAPEDDRCGSCRACLDACPTNAFPAPYRLDARRCISYLTIEHAGPIPAEFRAAIGNRIYGCDDCLAVCPWNKFAQTGAEMKLSARADLMAPPIADLLGFDDTAFRERFSGSPVKRIGRNRFLRNLLIAAGNSGTGALGGKVTALLDDPDPVVRGTAVWAAGRLLPAEDLAALGASRLDQETDPEVRAEWDAVLGPRPADETGDRGGKAC